MNRDFYVTMIRDGRRVAYLAGPFATHDQALGLVDQAKRLATDIDQWACFDAFGTASMPHAASNPIGKLNRRLDQ